MTTQLGVVELRQYTLEPGRRDEMIAIFERHFIESQEEAGMQLLGHFRDRGDPDRFVWFRGFADMPSRKAALETFYGSDLWHEHRDAVNETIVDSDDVLLLRPAGRSPFRAGTSRERGLVGATIWPLAEPASAETVGLFTEEVAPQLAVGGATQVALLVTEPSANDFPRLPVREGENVLVWVARFDDAATYEAAEAALDASRRAFDGLAGAPHTLCLLPAERSRLA